MSDTLVGAAVHASPLFAKFCADLRGQPENGYPPAVLTALSHLATYLESPPPFGAKKLLGHILGQRQPFELTVYVYSPRQKGPTVRLVVSDVQSTRKLVRQLLTAGLRFHEAEAGPGYAIHEWGGVSTPVGPGYELVIDLVSGAQTAGVRTWRLQAEEGNALAHVWML